MMVQKLKKYTEPAKLDKTRKMFLIEMFESPIGIINGILSKIRCTKKPYQQKWERSDMIERALNQIEKDLDVVGLVKV